LRATKASFNIHVEWLRPIWKVPDLIQNAKSNIGTINEIIKQTNIKRGQHLDKGVINLIALNYYWKLRCADSQYNEAKQQHFINLNTSIARTLKQYPIGWKNFPISDLMCYKFNNDYY
jgi:hypothetical protein